MAAPRVVVLGVGNLLLSDEGVGVRCIEALERDARVPSSVRLIDGGTSTHELLEDLEDLDVLILVDAVLAGRAPGTLLRLEGAEIPAAFSSKLSPHQHGINDLLASLTLLGRAPREVVLFGVEPASLSLSLELSPIVATAMPALVERVLRELHDRGLAAHGS
ncbi:MAG: HyaD/HybD family hydrogenase maturation endopeptidase [Polyangiales bacterium]